MPLDIPAELKKISPYVRRAEELDKDKAPESRLVAYYCRQYAVHTGIPLSTSPASKVCLGHILENLEAEKPAMDNFTRDEAAFLCRQFANRVFDKANAEDRMGLANQGTAKTFYAASTFLQILEQFSTDDDGNEEFAEDRKRIVYAKWKSTDILKAIKEGRAPTPGGYGEDQEDDEDDDEEEDEEEIEDEGLESQPAFEKKEDAPAHGDSSIEGVEMELPPSVPLSSPPKPPSVAHFESAGRDDDHDQEIDLDQEQGTEIELGPPPAYPGEMFESSTSNSRVVDRPKVTFEMPPVVPPSRPADPPKPKSGGSGGILFGFGSKKKTSERVSKEHLADATELTRFAMAALEDKDADLAARRLKQALEALGR
jgi:vacuolar protein sorting-associated protein VTA1